LAYHFSARYIQKKFWYEIRIGPKHWGLPLQRGTSPSISAVPGGYEVAYHAADGTLVTVGTGGPKHWGLPLAPGTSPSISLIAGM
jgi:hypothetical protein